MFKVMIARAAEEMRRLRPMWEALHSDGHYTIFQNYKWNELAARHFADRESPFVVLAESDSGAAIIPTAIRHQHKNGRRELTLLGETLFDYRNVLWSGDESVLDAAWAAVSATASEHHLSFAMDFLRVEQPSPSEETNRAAWSGFDITFFTSALSICRWDSRGTAHTRLSRNMRRLQRLGCEMKRYCGDSTALIRHVYELKSLEEHSLFRDPARIQMAVAMARADPYSCEIFTLEQGGKLVAALVTYLDGRWRRFYTTYHDPNHSCAKLSPGLVLIHEVVQHSLANGLDCDFMTGDQPYKNRLATSSAPLYRVTAFADKLRAMTAEYTPARVA